MEQILYPAAAFVTALVFTAVLMPRLLRFCNERGLFDIPNERKVHHNKIPRLGGVFFAPSIVMGMSAVAVLMLLLGGPDVSLSVSATLLFAALFMIFTIGIIDDLLGLDAKIKFWVQIAASVFMPLCHLYINNLYGFCGIYEIPVWVGYPLTVFISLLIINAFNLIDGIDGLSSLLSIVCLGIFAFIFHRLGVTLYVSFIASLLGSLIVFFFFNFFGSEKRGHKTFMGDTGSLILGYSIAYLAIKYAMYNPEALQQQRCPILISYTLVFVPVIDLARVAVWRKLQHKGMFVPDKTHIHHLFLATGMSMHAALAWIVGLQLLFNVANIVMFRYLHVCSTLIVAFDLVVYALVIVLLYRFRKAEPASGR